MRRNCLAGMRWPGLSMRTRIPPSQSTSAAPTSRTASTAQRDWRNTPTAGVTVIRDAGGRSQVTIGFARHCGSRASGRHRRRAVPRPGEPVLSAHALPRRAGRARCGDPGRGGGRGGLGEDHRRLPAMGRGRAGTAVDGGDIRPRNAALRGRRGPRRRGTGRGAQQSPGFRAGGDRRRLDRAWHGTWPF